MSANKSGYAIYARTAAGGQAEVDVQIRAARAALHRDGATALQEYVDVNVSGIGPRPLGLCTLLRDAATGRFEVLVIRDLTRLGRSLARCWRTLAALEARGVRIACVHDSELHYVTDQVGRIRREPRLHEILTAMAIEEAP